MRCLYKMIDPMKNLINPPKQNLRVTHMSKSISYSLPVNRKLTFWTKWESPRGRTGAHLDVKPRTNIVWVHKVSLHFIVKAAWVFVFWCHHLSKHFGVFFLSVASAGNLLSKTFRFYSPTSRWASFFIVWRRLFSLCCVVLKWVADGGVILL